MKKLLILFLIASTAFSCKNTQSAANKDNSDPSKYVKLISEKDLKTMLYVVASDEMKGRETGSAGQKKAGLYMIDQYKKAVSLSQKVLQIFTSTFQHLI